MYLPNPVGIVHCKQSDTNCTAHNLHLSLFDNGKNPNNSGNNFY